MAERKHITLIYHFNENWIGGTYYVLNIIKVLNLLDEELKPKLTIAYSQENSIKEIKEIGYPYISFHHVNLRYNYFERLVNKIYWVYGKIAFRRKISNGYIQNLYPVSIEDEVKNAGRFYYWIPDFQERHLPLFFSEKEKQDRLKTQNIIKNSGKPIVFSSQNALDDYNQFYPDNQNKKEIINFVSMIDDSFKVIPIDALRKKFNITRRYFVVPNQFWIHKNQTAVIKAVKLLKDQDIDDFQVVFTGKEYDHRNPDLVKNLKEYVIDHNLESNILFLGFIDRNEQLQLMKNSISIIQPSLFEGWSTVVEDCKALEQFIILSDIPLHREQIADNCVFFNPRDEEDLAAKIKEVLTNEVVVRNVDYQKLKLEFAKRFLDIF